MLDKIEKKKTLILILSILICIWTLFVIVHYSGYSFWGDEMGTIVVANPIHSLSETLKIWFNEDYVQVPLFFIIAHFWMKISPYGTKWLLLICELMVLIGFLINEENSKWINGRLTGLLCLIFNCLCSYIVIQGAYEFRPYAMNYMFSSLLIFMFIKKHFQMTTKNLILYGITGVLLNYTHYTTIMLFAALFIADFFEWLRKREDIKFLISYLIWGIFYFPFIIMMYVHVRSSMNKFWLKTPKYSDFFRISHQLLQNKIIFAFYIIAIVSTIIWLSYKIIKHSKLTIPEQVSAYCIWMILGMKILIFAFSKYINPNYSLWLPRYFMCLIPAMLLIITLFWAKLIEIAKKKQAICSILCLFLLIMLGICEKDYIKDLKENRYPEIERQPFEQAAEILRQQPDFWDNTTAIYSSGYVVEAWQYYLAHGDMKPGLLNFIPRDMDGVNPLEYKTIYVFIVEEPMPEEVQAYLNAHFDKEELEDNYQLFKYTRK